MSESDMRDVSKQRKKLWIFFKLCLTSHFLQSRNSLGECSVRLRYHTSQAFTVTALSLHGSEEVADTFFYGDCMWLFIFLSHVIHQLNSIRTESVWGKTRRESHSCLCFFAWYVSISKIQPTSCLDSPLVADDPVHMSASRRLSNYSMNNTWYWRPMV